MTRMLRIGADLIRANPQPSASSAFYFSVRFESAPNPRRDAPRIKMSHETSTTVKLKLLVLALFAAGVAALLLLDGAGTRPAHAFSAGPPAGYTRAPGELDCSECHLIGNPGTGRIAVAAPQTYTPGQTYDITVTHTNADQTRIRWGFQLTALDAADERAGALAPLDATTQVVSNQGPFPARQYVEHTSQGTFTGRQNGASWTFRWTAPAADVGPVTFYAAGNQADGDGNSSGDNIYFTFATATFQPPTPDFSVSVAPASRAVAQGGATTYTVTVTPLNGFAGTVALTASGLPSGATATLQPDTLNFASASSQTATLNVQTAAGAPAGTSTLTVSAAGGGLTRTAQAALTVAAPGSADLSLTQAVSPNPTQTGLDTRFTYTVTNAGPARAAQPVLTVRLPAALGAITPGQGNCALTQGPSENIYSCQLGGLDAGASRTVDLTLRPPAAGTFQVTATVAGAEEDFDLSNNSAAIALAVAPQSAGPRMTMPGLTVNTVVSGLEQPTTMAFVGADDFLVLEKASGRVRRVKDGRVVATVLDLAVNSASERGLLGVALHPNFAANGFVYLYWTESNTGADATAVDAVALLANRVDRFVWNGQTLTLDRNLIRLRALQTDAGQPARGNHNGGVLRFGPDGKLYVLVGDVGRRGLLQNIASGGPVPDDQFGGPEPDDAHLSGVVLRLNDDGTTPADNPFFAADAGLSGEAALNVKKIFAYGVRNGFGMDFDPQGGALWTQDNGDDSFDEINRFEAGANGGWIQLMGPSSRVAEYKAIEVARGNSLQQNRWPPSLIADTPEQALARLYQLPGSRYTEPVFSWKFAVAPAAVGFVEGNGLGLPYAGDLFVGASRTTLLGGYLFRLKLLSDRKGVASDDARLSDGVADNSDKFDLTESESLVVGRDFGVATDIRTGPDGRLYVVSLSNGAVYRVSARPTLYVARLDGAQEVPPTGTQATGTATILLDEDEKTALISLRFANLSAPQTIAHVHGPAAPGANAPPIFDLPQGNFSNFQVTLNPAQVSALKAGLLYANVHSTAHPAGEIRGQFASVAEPSAVQFEEQAASASEGAGRRTVNVVRLGDASGEVSVEYATGGGTASERSDYTTARGTLRFAAGETVKSFDVLLTDDGLQETAETIGLALSNPAGAAVLGPQSSAFLTLEDNDAAPSAANPIDEARFFVRQHYHDFLSREPDDAGLQFWAARIESCGADRPCVEAARVNVSAAFFLSIEFQETGYLVYRLYEEAFDRRPRYHEFVADTQEVGRGVVVGVGDWEARLAANRLAFAERFSQRPAFRGAFDALTNAQYVVELFDNAGVSPTAAERDALVAALDAGTKTRPRVLLDVAENADFKRAEFNRAFVLMQYFGYLRRNPDDPPDSDFSGYDFWLDKLNRFNGNFVQAEMVKAFILSIEYRARFGR
jgi:aldose sugar dehydrogenase